MKMKDSPVLKRALFREQRRTTLSLFYSHPFHKLACFFNAFVSMTQKMQ